MQVDVEHRLPGVFAAVHHHSIAIVRHPLFTGNLRCHQIQMPDQLAVGFGDVIDGGDGLLRNHQEMHRRLGIDVTERQADVVLVENVCWNFPVDDLGENRL